MPQPSIWSINVKGQCKMSVRGLLIRFGPPQKVENIKFWSNKNDGATFSRSKSKFDCPGRESREGNKGWLGHVACITKRPSRPNPWTDIFGVELPSLNGQCLVLFGPLMQLCDCWKNYQIEQFSRALRLIQELSKPNKKQTYNYFFIRLNVWISRTKQSWKRTKLGDEWKKNRRGVTRVIVSREAH